MPKNLYFDLAAIFVLTMILISAFFRKITKGKANRMFLLAVFSILVTAVFDTFAIFFDNLGPGNVAAKYFFHTGYLLIHTLTSGFYLLYLIALTDTWHRLLRKKIYVVRLSLPAAVYFVLTVVSLFRHWLFYLDENDAYTRGPLFFASYLVAAFYLTYGMIYIIRYRRLFTPKWILTLFSPYPVLLAATVIQFFFPNLIIELFVNSIVMMFVADNIQRPEELLDPLTGFGNTSTYTTICKKAFSNQKKLMIIRCEIAGYSALRDLLGLEQGHRLIREASQKIESVCRRTDVRADLCHTEGGDFFVIVEENHFEKVGECAETLSRALNFSFISGNTVTEIHNYICVFSIPEDVPDFGTLTTVRNLFDNRTSLHTDTVYSVSELLKENRNRILLDIDRIIENALEDHRLEVYYQPIYAVSEGRFNSAEALLRLKDPKFGFIPPDLFIPAAERSGAIHRVGDFVLGEVCRFIASKEFKELGLDYIELNLSVRQCMQDNLVSRILSTLKEYDIDPRFINLEVTETAATVTDEKLYDALGKFRRTGISVSLDDFGSGYSNIQRLTEMPIDIIKLDKSFADSAAAAKGREVIRQIFGLLQIFDSKVLIEGIETEETARFFTELGCDYIQGFYYSKPLPKKSFTAFITEKNRIAR